MLQTYGKILALGSSDRRIHGLLDDPVVVEEKIDGSQFSFEVDTLTGDLVVRSKGQIIECLDAPDQLFAPSIGTVVKLFESGMLEPGLIYRGEAQSKLKHVTITYGRVAKGNIVLFDVVKRDGTYMTVAERQYEADRLGIEATQVFFNEEIVTVDQIKSLIGTESMLGGHTIEGVVIKNYHNWFVHGDGSMAPKRAKYVDDLFKEKHKKDWRSENPNRGDIIADLVAELSSEVRFGKLVQRLREDGELEGDPRDIGKLMKAFHDDIVDEEAAYIKDRLFDAFIKNIVRGAGKELPYWYKRKLLEEFEGSQEDSADVA
jgi:hypothetical protein